MCLPMPSEAPPGTYSTRSGRRFQPSHVKIRRGDGRGRLLSLLCGAISAQEGRPDQLGSSLSSHVFANEWLYPNQVRGGGGFLK